MNIEELRAEANRLGFSLNKKITYEKVLPCRCGSKHIRSEIVVRGKYYRCADCGNTSEVAKTKYQAIINWNNAVKQ